MLTSNYLSPSKLVSGAQPAFDSPLGASSSRVFLFVCLFLYSVVTSFSIETAETKEPISHRVPYNIQAIKTRGDLQ